MSWKVGVDIGGTFTDFAVTSEDRSIYWKEPSTPDSPTRAIETGLANIASELGLGLEEFLGEISLFVHGSTIAINTILQSRGPKVGLVCTRGFRDVLYLRDGFKWERFNPRLRHPGTLVERYLRVGVDERVDGAGRVLRPLDEESVRNAARMFRAWGVESVAVSLLWSHVNPSHELAIRRIFNQEMPYVPVVLSSEILPETGEWVRTSAAAISAYVYPQVKDYLIRLSRALRDAGLRRPPLIMQLNGGCSTVEHTLRFPVNMIGSGPAAFPSAAIRASDRLAARDVIAIDMGGTSFDVCLIKDREIPRSRGLSVAHQPLGVAGIDVHSVGAGGGSIAWIDSGGALRVGPQSAGAEPGPAAYGAGGTEPTVTDANVVLGYLSPGNFLGGRRCLHGELAADAIRKRVAEPLGIDVVEAAAGIVRIVNENMVNAIGVVSVQRGINPKHFLLVVGGGAGGLHAGRLAKALGIRRVLVPAEAATISAFGMAAADVRHDYTVPLHTTSVAPDTGAVASGLATAEERASQELKAAGFADDAIVLERFVDARYRGQVHELITPVPTGPLDEAAFELIADTFHRLHAERYGWSRQDYTIEYVHWRVTARGVISQTVEPPFPAEHDGAALPEPRARRAYFPEFSQYRETPAYRAEDLTAGMRVRGPAIIDADTTTIVVFPDDFLSADGRGNFLMDVVP